MTAEYKTKMLADVRVWIFAVISGALMCGTTEAQHTIPDNQRIPMPLGGTPVTLMMDGTRGDAHYGPNFIELQTPCQNSKEGSCYCALEFKAMNSQEFAGYIASFGDSRVPAVFQVWYRRNGQAGRGLLVSVGSWTSDKFPGNDRLLSVGLKGIKAIKPDQVQHFRLPADCLPPKKSTSTHSNP